MVPGADEGAVRCLQPRAQGSSHCPAREPNTEVLPPCVYSLSAYLKLRAGRQVPQDTKWRFSLVSLTLRWFIKLQTFSKYIDFPKCFCLLVDCFLGFWFWFQSFLLYVSLRNLLCIMCTSIFFVLGGFQLFSISVFLYSLLQRFKALFFIQQFLLHLWEFSLQLFNLLREINANKNVCKYLATLF